MAGPWDDYAPEAGAPWEDFTPAEQPKATWKDRLQAVNAGASRGVAAVAGMAVDTGTNILDLGKAAIGAPYIAISGKAPPKWLQAFEDRSKILGSSQNIAGLMNRAGLNTEPSRPDDKASRYLYAGGAALPAAAVMRPGSAVEAVTQGAQAASIGMVPQAVADMGGGADAQTAATLAASVLVPAGVGTVRAVRGAAQPMTEAGRRQIAGAAIRGAATNADDAMKNMDDARPLVPGSQPTAGQAARDSGIAFFENRLRALNTQGFSTRMSAQNDARQRLLDTIARGGEPAAIGMMEARREAITTALRDRAFQQASGKPAPTQNVVRRIDALLKNPENAGQSVQKALQAVRGQMFDAKNNLQTDAKALYAVRKEINRVLDGKYVDADESVMRYAGGQLSKVRSAIDDAITDVAPDWKPYLTKYAQLSRPIDRAQEIASIRQKTALAAPDVTTGRDFLSQPKWRNVVSKNMPELSKLLTKGQTQKMQMIAADLDRGAAATNSASIRVPGSDTAANLATHGQLSVANIIGRTIGKDVKDLPPALGTVTRPLSFVYKLPDAKVRELIVDAMLDPKLAAQLMREGTRENIEALADSLKRQAELSGIIVSTEVADARRRLGSE
jgi:hypothetical protein